MDTLYRAMHERQIRYQESIGKIKENLVLDDKGTLHLPPLDKAVPEEVERMQRRVYALLPHLSLLLDYFHDEALRRRILTSFNKGEALHALARQLFFGQLCQL